MSRIKGALLIILCLNAAVWFGSRHVYARWDGVPPPPSKRGAALMTLGDLGFSYRLMALSLQTLGDVGRDITPLKNYDYNRIGAWLFLLHSLDPISDHAPMIAAYYFGATRIPKDAEVIAHYLATVGQAPWGGKWKWLAHAAYLEQHRVHDFDQALKLSYKLVQMNREGVKMPQWARQMPVFILSKQGDRHAARELMENMLLTDEYSDPAELNFMKSYLVDELGADSNEIEALIRRREHKGLMLP